MQKLIGLAATVVLANPLVAAAQVPAVDEQVTQAVQLLPADLRAGATVVTYDRSTGARQVLRQGSNFIECQPRNPDDGFRRCYNKALGPRRDLEAKLKAEKKSDREIQEVIAEATSAGTIKPTPFGTISYRLYGKKDRIQLLWVMSVPNATPESIGVSAGSQRDEALKVDSRPVFSTDDGLVIDLSAASGPKGSEPIAVAMIDRSDDHLRSSLLGTIVSCQNESAPVATLGK